MDVQFKVSEFINLSPGEQKRLTGSFHHSLNLAQYRVTSPHVTMGYVTVGFALGGLTTCRVRLMAPQGM